MTAPGTIPHPLTARLNAAQSALTGTEWEPVISDATAWINALADLICTLASRVRDIPDLPPELATVCTLADLITHPPTYDKD